MALVEDGTATNLFYIQTKWIGLNTFEGFQFFFRRTINARLLYQDIQSE